MLRNILVPLDGSSRAEVAVSHAAALAGFSEAVVVLLRVVEEDPGQGVAVDPVHFRFAQQRASEYLRRIATGLTAKGTRTRWEVRVGKPADQIVDFASSHGIDLIVLSSHGRGDATAFGLGGTAHKVVEGAGVSVMLIPSAEHLSGAPAAVAYRRIVVPVDRSPRSDWAVSFGAGIARASEGELVLVHVIPTPDSEGLAPSGSDEQQLAETLIQLARTRAEYSLREVIHQLTESGLAARYRMVESAHSAASIADIAREERADLTLLVAHGSAGETRLPYGSVCAKLLAMGTGVTLVLQDQPSPSRALEPIESSPRPRGLAARP
ncbi:MAG TPA: universal stress protein [Gemmatimonadales bacterium]